MLLEPRVARVTTAVTVGPSFSRNPSVISNNLCLSRSPRPDERLSVIFCHSDCQSVASNAHFGSGPNCLELT